MRAAEANRSYGDAVAVLSTSGYSPLQRAGRPTRKGAPVYRVESLRKEAFGFLGPTCALAYPSFPLIGLTLPFVDIVAAQAHVFSLAWRNEHFSASAILTPRTTTHKLSHPQCSSQSFEVNNFRLGRIVKKTPQGGIFRFEGPILSL
jgi:hypothetical protein